MTVHRVKVSDYKAKKADEGSIEIEMDDGTVYKVPPVELWSDAVLMMSESDPVGCARAVMGAEYDAFVNAGGGAALMLGIVQDTLGISVPE